MQLSSQCERHGRFTFTQSVSLPEGDVVTDEQQLAVVDIQRRFLRIGATPPQVAL